MSGSNPNSSSNQNTHQPSGFSLFFPFSFIFGPNNNTDTNNPPTTNATEANMPNGQQPNINLNFELPINNQNNINNNDTSTQQTHQQQEGNDFPNLQTYGIHFFVHATTGENGEPNRFFFTPFFMGPTQQTQKPRASENAMKELPIVEITQENIDEQASCPICLELFIIKKDLNSVDQENQKIDIKKESQNREENNEKSCSSVIREMPCKHLFCEPCLFEWLRQNNTCPLCRDQIEAEVEGQEQEPSQNNNIDINHHDNPINEATVENVSQSTVRIAPTSNAINSSNNRSSQSRTRYGQHSHPYHSPPNRHSSSNYQTSCALERVGCCGEVHNANEQHTTIITLPQCHHRFHTSCLRTSLLVEGYTVETISPLSFRCPTCRAPANLQGDVLKSRPTAISIQSTPSSSHGEGISTPTESEQLMGGERVRIPLSVRLPNNDMELD
ncbi:hypothetical protein G9A89_019372 [Geosiphon pyriformis]|nr:hypothetical protein G9A89_019372 [Geosiphon pyriformis]